MLLKQPDLSAERRPGQVQSRGGWPEVQLLGYRDEVPQLAQLHAFHVTPWKAAPTSSEEAGRGAGPGGRRTVESWKRVREERDPMIKQASNVLKHLRRSITADPERFAGGTALVGPLALLAVEQERRARQRSPQPNGNCRREGAQGY